MASTITSTSDAGEHQPRLAACASVSLRDKLSAEAQIREQALGRVLKRAAERLWMYFLEIIHKKRRASAAGTSSMSLESESAQSQSQGQGQDKQSRKGPSNIVNTPMGGDELMYVTSDGRHHAYNHATRIWRWLSPAEQDGCIIPHRACDVLGCAIRVSKGKRIVNTIRALAIKYAYVLGEIQSLCGWTEDHLLAPPGEPFSQALENHPIHSVISKFQQIRSGHVDKSTSSLELPNGSVLTWEQIHEALSALYKKLVVVSELITQNTIMLDQVETEGVLAIRHHRRKAVRQMVGLGDRVDHLKADALVMMKESGTILNEMRAIQAAIEAEAAATLEKKAETTAQETETEGMDAQGTAISGEHASVSTAQQSAAAEAAPAGSNHVEEMIGETNNEASPSKSMEAEAAAVLA